MIRKLIIHQMTELLCTVQSGIDYISQAQGAAADQVAENCQYALEQVIQVIQKESLASAELCLEKLRLVSAEMKPGLSRSHCQIAKQRLCSVQKRLAEEPVQLEIAFFPYKASMWDCMESVWRAAAEDTSCDCYVVPIPYYDRNPDQSLGTFHYEGAWFPKDVPVVDYESYNAAARRPDIIYIHNPYDEYNRVTSVDPRFYSHALKKHTDMLVYIPYYIAGHDGITANGASAFRYVDRVAAQSEEMRRCFLDLGIPDGRILALGNPKFDAILNHAEMDCLPEWEETLAGKTVFLVSTSLTDLLTDDRDWLSQTKTVLSAILAQKDCAAIWRPHPLTEATIKSMRPNALQAYQDMKQTFLLRDSFILDSSSSVLPAFAVSDALFCDRSSIVSQYAVTGKPVHCFMTKKARLLAAKYRFFDCTEFYLSEDGFPPQKFIEMVRAGDDTKKAARMSAIFSSVYNLDGTIGKKIHKAVTEQVREAENLKKI